MSKYIFNKAYAETVSNIVKQMEIEPYFNYKEAREIDLQASSSGQFEILRFFTSLFLTTVVRGAKIRSALTPGFV